MEIKNCKESLDKEGKKSESHRNDLSQQRDRQEHAIMLKEMNSFTCMLDELQRLQAQNQAMTEYISTHSHICSPKPLPYQTYKPRDMRELLRIPNLDEAVLSHVLSRAGGLKPEDRGRAEHVVDTHQFKDWVLGQQMMKLLVHGDFDLADNVSPFSVLCATLVRALRNRRGYVGLVFF